MPDTNQRFYHKLPERAVKQFILAGWVRYHSETQSACRACQSSPARFIYDAYGYENIANDLSQWDKAIRQKKKISQVAVAAWYADKLYEAQQRGIYLVIGSVPLCGECFASTADAFTTRDYIGAYTITKLLSSAGNVSCVLGTGILSGYYENKRVPLLLHTQARTLDEFLASLRNQESVFLE